MGVLVGLIWRAIKSNQQSIQDRNGTLFFVSVNCTMSAVFTVLSAFGPERTVFERERSHGMYRCSSMCVSVPCDLHLCVL